TTFVVGSVLVPEQRSVRTPEGLHVTIPGEAMHRVGTLLEERKEVIGAQVHSHPRRAYHSDADDALAVATKRGALSLVVPYFAKAGVRAEGTIACRLLEQGWTALNRETL